MITDLVYCQFCEQPIEDGQRVSVIETNENPVLVYHEICLEIALSKELTK